MIGNTVPPHLGSVFDLDYTQTNTIEPAWFVAHFVASMSLARLTKRAVVQGWLADSYGLQASFLLTAACRLCILFYALWGSRPAAAAD